MGTDPEDSDFAENRPGQGPRRVTVAPDLRRRLSDGALVEASIRARLLGVPLLKIEATIVLVPAQTTGRSAALHEPPARASGRSSGVPPTRTAPAGRGLAEAVRSINDGARLLAQVQRNGA